MDNPIINNASQRGFWTGSFGDKYIDRNYSLKQINELYKSQTGITVEKIFNDFFDNIDRNSKILEVGCNIGINLSVLRNMGFSNLSGLDVSKKALDIAKKNYPEINFYNSSIEEFDSQGKKYDLVYTAGVLIHINPSTINHVIDKIANLSNRYIFGFEYFSDTLTEINYRGNMGFCWKQNFPKLYKELFPSLKILKEKKFFYKDENFCDIAYLLEK